MKPDLTEIKNAAYGRWPEIHAALGIPAKLLNTRKHQPCPHCGGKDRFRYTDHKHGGGYICNQCTPEGGSGFDLLMLVFGYSFTEAVNQVSALLGLSGGRAERREPLPAQPEQPLADRQAALLAAEGIETALAASALFDLPAAACLSAHGLSAFDWPPETRELYIAADNDLSRTGIKAAEALARRAHAAGLTVKIWQPDKAGTDALDEWNARKGRLKTEGAAQ